MTLYIECSSTLLWGNNTGIQRVVRNIVNNADASAPNEQVIPVAWDGQSFLAVGVPIAATQPIRLALALRAIRAIQRLRGAWFRLKPVAKTQAEEQAERRRPDHFESQSKLRSLAKRALSILRFGFSPRRVDITKGDTLLLADANWDDPRILAEARSLRDSGATIGVLIYDLIPLEYPDFFNPPLAELFASWFETVSDTCDFALCISNHVAERLRSNGNWSERPVYTIPLGCDLDGLPRLAPDTATGPPTFLVVGTIEPRKNHTCILDAFDLLWSRGLTPRLQIVGRYGWLADELAERLRSHPQRGGFLMWSERVDDRQLQELYRTSSASIMASHAEGFGLPVVESLRLGTPVIASDIPSHREIADDFCIYFDKDNPADLANKVEAFMAGERPPRQPAEFDWPDWDAATEQILRDAASAAQEARSRNG